MLKDAALLQLDLLPARAARGPGAQGRVAVQRAVARHATGVHRRRLVRAPAPGRAVGGLPAVLHAVPVSADAAGLQGPAVPRGAARLARRHRPARRARRARRRALPQGRAVNVLAARAAGVALRRVGGRDGQAGDAPRGLQQGAAGGELRQAREARARARVEGRARRPGPATARTTPTTTVRGGAKAEFVREAAARRRSRAGLGRRLQRRRATRASRPSRPTSWSRSTPTTRPSTRSTGGCARSAARTSCRWS